MKADLKSLTKKVEASRKALLADYDPETLHVLRIAIRRIRTHLHAIADKDAQKQRERWAKIVSRTNAARDWDVFWCDLEAELNSSEFKTIEPVLRERRDKARARVLSLLASKDWDNSIARWHRHLEDFKQRKRGETLSLPLGKVEHRLAKTSHKALTRSADKDWHKLRIATKELRYTLDERSQTLGKDKQLEAQLSWCKTLQETLGDWHDCVIQRDLLEELHHQLGKGADHPGQAVIAALFNRVDARQQACLSQARSLLGARPGLRARD